jgi:tRNA threonylcarbamoyl adenosine modification protein YeaZ
MLQLAIDTSSGFIQIALKDQHKFYIKKSDKQQQQAEDVALMLNDLLVSTGHNFSQISKVFCVVGPASFTGIRISLAFVKGLILGQNIEVVAISNFHVFISNFLKQISNYDNSHILLDCGKNKQEYYYFVINNKFIEQRNFYKINLPSTQQEIATIISYKQAQEMILANQDNDFFLGDFTNLADYIVKRDNVSIKYENLNLIKLFDLPSNCYQEKLAPIYLRKAVY